MPLKQLRHERAQKEPAASRSYPEAIQLGGDVGLGVAETPQPSHERQRLLLALMWHERSAVIGELLTVRDVADALSPDFGRRHGGPGASPNQLPFVPGKAVDDLPDQPTGGAVVIAALAGGRMDPGSSALDHDAQS
jgi:hypothetical protein